MALTKQKKSEIIKKVSEVLRAAKSVVFVNFHGLGVAKSTTMRRALRDAGVGYLVAKKTLARKALTDAKVKGEMPELRGEIALAYGDDLTTPAREVYKFQKEFKEAFSIVGGVFEGVFMNQTQMTEIAAIPPLQILYGQFVNLINSPLQGFVFALDAIASKKS